MPFSPDGGWPHYPVSMQAVWFPTATALEAIAACNHAAQVLNVDLQQRPDWVADAREDWEGPYRREFDAAIAAHVYRTHDLRQRIATLARAIEAAIANVQAENQVRAGRRAEYDRQLAEDERRATEAAAAAATGG